MPWKYHKVVLIDNKLKLKPLDKCCKNEFYVVVVQHLSFFPNISKLYHQCLNCGHADRKKQLPHKLYSEKIKGEFNEDRFLKRKEEVQKESQDWYAGEQAQFKSSYNNHLNSDKWKEIRERRLKIDNYTCQECRTERATEVHHLSYESLGDELMEHLQSLCRNCHKNKHNK